MKETIFTCIIEMLFFSGKHETPMGDTVVKETVIQKKLAGPPQANERFTFPRMLAEAQKKNNMVDSHMAKRKKKVIPYIFCKYYF